MIAQRAPSSEGPGFIVLSFIHSGRRVADFDERLGRGLAALHQSTATAFGFAHDGYCGITPQPNGWLGDWVSFYAERRLRFQLALAADTRNVSAPNRRAMEALIDKLPELLGDEEPPALIHGDLWTTNILAKDGRITGFIDPAVYYGHPEIELAYSTLFGTFTDPFFHRYHEICPISDGFFEVRRDIYNMYPLLVHVRLFGATYLGGIENVLDHHGY